MPRLRTATLDTPELREIVTNIVSSCEVDIDYNEVCTTLTKDSKAMQSLAENIYTSSRLCDSVRLQSQATAEREAKTVAEQVSSVATKNALDLIVTAINNALSAPDASPSKVRRKLSPVLPPSGKANVVEQQIERFCAPKRAIVPLLLLGEQGAGKTYGVRSVAKNYDHFIEVPCHAGMEAKDFIGGPLPDGNKFSWTDGGIARAFRLAAAGKSVLLLVDEIFRVPTAQRSVFLTCLSPDETGAEPVYKLKTERVIDEKGGVKFTEELIAPVANLSIVGTTNIGGQFAVSEDDPAMAERWMFHYVYCTAPEIKRVIKSVLLEYSASESEADDISDKYVAFWQKASELKKLGTINLAPTIRTLTRAVKIATAHTALAHHEAVMTVAPMWAGTDLDGRLNTQQIENIALASKGSFKC
jgi:MoxR-like ATPase